MKNVKDCINFGLYNIARSSSKNLLPRGRMTSQDGYSNRSRIVGNIGPVKSVQLVALVGPVCLGFFNFLRKFDH